MRSCGLATRLTCTTATGAGRSSAAGGSSAPRPSAAVLASSAAAALRPSAASPAAGSDGSSHTAATRTAPGSRPLLEPPLAGSPGGRPVLAGSAGAATLGPGAERRGFLAGPANERQGRQPGETLKCIHQALMPRSQASHPPWPSPPPAGSSAGGWALECLPPGRHAGALPPAERRPAPGPALAARGRGRSAAASAALAPVASEACARVEGCWGPASLGWSSALLAASAASRDALTCAICSVASAVLPACGSSAAVSEEAVVQLLLPPLFVPLVASAGPPALPACPLSWLASQARVLLGRCWLALPAAAGAGSGRAGLGLTASTARGSSVASGERS